MTEPNADATADDALIAESDNSTNVLEGGEGDVTQDPAAVLESDTDTPPEVIG